MIVEAFTTLLRDPAHWEFELFLMGVFDGLLGAVLWPLLKRAFRREHGHDVSLAERVAALEAAVTPEQVFRPPAHKVPAGPTFPVVEDERRRGVAREIADQTGWMPTPWMEGRDA